MRLADTIEPDMIIMRLLYNIIVLLPLFVVLRYFHLNEYSYYLYFYNCLCVVLSFILYHSLSILTYSLHAIVAKIHIKYVIVKCDGTNAIITDR